VKIDARLLVRLYQRQWRERYGDELAALLEESPVGWRVCADIAGGAIRERWSASPSIGRVGIMLLAPNAIALAIAGVSALISQMIWAQYGASPAFHSHIVGDIPKICYPPAITAWPLQFGWLSWLALFRPIAAGLNADMMARWKVRAAEIPVWAALLLVVATVTTTVRLADNCGYTQNQANLLRDAFISSTTPLMMLFMSSTFALRWQREQAARKRPAPTDFTKLGLG